MLPRAVAPMVDRRTRRLLGGFALSSLGAGLPWPLLLVLAWEQTHDERAVALVGAARMLPYVLLSWWTGRLADRFARDAVIRVTFVLRTLAAVAGLLALDAGQLGWAVAAYTLVVALGTPTYPAVAAALPSQTSDLAQATTCMVTLEVGGFVLGPAVGGLLLGDAVRWTVPVLTLGLMLGAVVVFGRYRLARATTAVGAGAQAAGSGVVRFILGHGGVARAIVIMCLLNLVDGLVGVTLVPLAEEAWQGSASAFGVATAFLGFGALGAPLIALTGLGAYGRARAAILVCAAALAVVAPTTSLGWALGPLAVAGATSVVVEGAATEILQDRVPDRLRASVFGLTDALIVAAALVGTLVAPALVALAGMREAIIVAAAVTAIGVPLVRAPGRTPSLPSDPEVAPDPLTR